MGKEYRGKMDRTRGGYFCQQWNAKSPHVPAYIPPDKDTASNYCRNPSGDPEPWCYTTDPSKRFDLCDIPMCPGK